MVTETKWRHWVSLWSHLFANSVSMVVVGSRSLAVHRMSGVEGVIGGDCCSHGQVCKALTPRRWLSVGLPSLAERDPLAVGVCHLKAFGYCSPLLIPHLNIPTLLPSGVCVSVKRGVEICTAVGRLSRVGCGR